MPPKPFDYRLSSYPQIVLPCVYHGGRVLAR